MQIAITVNGQSMTLHRDNATVFVHADSYKYLDHVFVHTDGATQGTYIFNQRDLIQMMMDSEAFRYVWSPAPTMMDIEAWQQHSQYQAAEFERQRAAGGLSEEDIAAFAEEVSDGINWDELAPEDPDREEE